MQHCEGDLKAAEYMMDCGVYMFYYRMKHKAIYAAEIEKQMKEK